MFALLPLFNRDRLRPGRPGGRDAGGARARSALLLPDLARRPGRSPKRRRADAAFAFTREQLDVYGIYELQVLEDLLRSTGAVRGESIAGGDGEDRRPRSAGRGRLRRPTPSASSATFYAAQRARLEQKMLLGQRQERKRAAATRRP